jgi:hypothetical protein
VATSRTRRPALRRDRRRHHRRDPPRPPGPGGAPAVEPRPGDGARASTATPSWRPWPSSRPRAGSRPGRPRARSCRPRCRRPGRARGCGRRARRASRSRRSRWRHRRRRRRPIAGPCSCRPGVPDPRRFPVDPPGPGLAARGAAARADAPDLRARPRATRRCGRRWRRGSVGPAGSRASAEHVLVTRGSQMALDVCARALLRPGDRVAVEALGVPGPAWDALRLAGAVLVPIAVDRDGLDVAGAGPGPRPGAAARALHHAAPPVPDDGDDERRPAPGAGRAGPPGRG